MKHLVYKSILDAAEAPHPMSFF